MSSRLPSEVDLEAALRLTKTRLKVVSLAMAGAAWSAAVVLWLLIFIMIDHRLTGGVPDPLRHAALAVFLVGSSVWLALAGVLPLVRRINDLYAARLIEHAHPDLRNALVDAIQISRHREVPGSIRFAVMDRAVRDLDQVDVRRIVSTRRLRLGAWVNAGAVVLLLAYALAAPKPVMPSIKRAFGSHLPAPTRTQIVETTPPDGASVVRGEPVEFTARVDGRRPETATVRFSPDGGTTWTVGQQLTLLPDPTGRQWKAIKAGRDLRESMAWQIVAGDACSEIRRLEIRPVPEVTGVNVCCEYPRYTRLVPTTQPGGQIDAVVGTIVTVKAATNVPARDPVIVFGHPPARNVLLLPEPSAQQPKEVTATFQVVTDDEYRIEFKDAYQQPNRDSLRFSIRARPDQPPTVAVDRPAPETELLPEDALPLQATLQDDFGLTRAVLAYRLENAEDTPREIALPLPPRTSGGAAALREQVPLAKMNARSGNVIEWWVSVWDNREDLKGQPSHQRTNSPPRRLVVRNADTLATADKKSDQKEPRKDEKDTPAPASQPADTADHIAADSKEASSDQMTATQPSSPQDQVAASQPAGTPQQTPSSRPAQGSATVATAQQGERSQAAAAPDGGASQASQPAESQPSRTALADASAGRNAQQDHQTRMPNDANGSSSDQSSDQAGQGSGESGRRPVSPDQAQPAQGSHRDGGSEAARDFNQSHARELEALEQHLLGHDPAPGTEIQTPHHPPNQAQASNQRQNLSGSGAAQHPGTPGPGTGAAGQGQGSDQGPGQGGQGPGQTPAPGGQDANQGTGQGSRGQGQGSQKGPVTNGQDRGGGAGGTPGHDTDAAGQGSGQGAQGAQAGRVGQGTQADQAGQGTGENNPRQGTGQGAGQERPGSDQRAVSDQGSGDAGQAPGQATGQSSQGEGQAAGQGSGRTQGSDQGQGTGQEQAQGGGSGQGQGSGQGHGSGQGSGQGQGLGQGPGTGQGQSHRQGEGTGQSQGSGQGSGQDQGPGSGQGSATGQGSGQGQGQGPGQGSGLAQGSGQGQGQGQGQGSGKGSGQGSGQGQGQGQGSGQGSGQG
ncbi:MAG: hypothetical protein KA354_20965, partial [Phycisphaerae bacterium]|nr:hypothetical protein [Phycisphaerae bacterium]